jgi:hypothetical protein
MIGHGYYWRKVRDGRAVYLMMIKRWRCKKCGRTEAVLPNFTLGGRQYLLGEIEAALRLRFEEQESWAEIEAKLGWGGYPVLRTIQRWCASFGEQAERWLKAVERWLAQQDSQSGWLDAQGEALKAGNTEQALLKASEHLLAWGKLKWEEMRECGLEKRMHFLWLWGDQQGMGRLV